MNPAPPLLLPPPRVPLALIGALAFAKLLLHLVTATGYGLQRDEYLYLEMGRHLAWGYKEIPPLLAPLAALSRLWPGELGARLWPALGGAATVGLVGLLVRELRGGWWAAVAAMLAAAVAPVLLVMHHLFQPNFLDVLAWTTYFYLLVRFLHDPAPRWLRWFGVAVGVGMLGKYASFFFVLALLPALVLSGQGRWLRSRGFAEGLGLALLVLVPNLLWQQAHHWPVVSHMLGLQGGQLTHVRPADFLLDQLGMTLPGVLLWGSGVVFAFTPAGRPYRVLGWHFVLLMALMLATHAKNYYAAPEYPGLMALGAVAIERWTARLRRPVLLAARGAVAALVPLLVARVFPALVPLLPIGQLATYVTALVRTSPHMEGLVRWEDGELHPLPQDVADMQGWDEFAPLAARAWQRVPPAERPGTLLVGSNYGPAGACNWFGARYGLPACHSTNGSFSLWWPEPLPHVQAMIYLQEDPETPDVAAHFEQAEVVGAVQNPYARCQGSQVWLLRRPKLELDAFVRERVRITREGFDD